MSKTVALCTEDLEDLEDHMEKNKDPYKSHVHNYHRFVKDDESSDERMSE